MNIDPGLWAPVLAGLCTYRELQDHYTLDDFFEMQEALAFRDEIEKRQGAHNAK